jgi:hypothetical protein
MSDAKVQEMPQDQELTAEDIFGFNDIAENLVRFETPEWGKKGTNPHIYLRLLNGGELTDLYDSQADATKKKRAMVATFLKAACNKKGDPIFIDNPETLNKLLAKSAAPMVRAQEKLMQMNGMARHPKTWEALKLILAEVGVEDAKIELVRLKWQTPEEAAKNA